MNTLLNVNRELRDIEDPKLRAREHHIKKIQVSYGYDRANAEKVYEMMQVKQVELMWGTALGAFAAYKVGPIQREIEHSYGIFRKAWMRYPVKATAFGVGYYLATSLPARFGRKFSYSPEVTHDTYTSQMDLVSRFRLFENDESHGGSKEDQLLDYLASYSSEALSEPELVNQMMKRISKTSDISKIFQVKRSGKDLDNLFWSFGKIHGLENIAFADDKELEETNGNPVSLQLLINKIEKPNKSFSSYETATLELQKTLQAYKDSVNKLNLNPSDRKKMLALPFYMSKRQQKPEPRKGQFEMKLFEELTGMNWYDDARVKEDREEKITQFNYEKFIHPELLKGVDTKSPEFLEKIKIQNFFSKTKYEKLQDAKKEFSELMPFLSGLNEKEQRSLIHLLQNKSDDEKLLNYLTSDDIKIKLAQVSEAENYALKNRYRHQRKTMDYAEKKRMPIDESKVKDLLRNQHIFRDKMNSEIGTYQKLQDNPQMENGVLTYLNEAAYGEMKDLIRDVGIKNDEIPFHNLQSIRKLRDNHIHSSDSNFHYLMNALFTPVDMTDYEEEFVGWNELHGALPINRQSWLTPMQEEPHPKTDKLAGIEQLEKRPILVTSPSYQAIIEARNADVEEEEEEYDEEEAGDEEYGEEAEGGEEAAAEEDYGEEVEVEEWPPKDRIPHVAVEDRFFLGGKNSLRENYSEVEIGAFMKVLNVKPHRQWEDTSTHHYKLGVHTYEDTSQELDPSFHILSEEERKAAERIKTEEWRKGAEVKIAVGNKRPIHIDNRF